MLYQTYPHYEIPSPKPDHTEYLIKSTPSLVHLITESGFLLHRQRHTDIFEPLLAYIELVASVRLNCVLINQTMSALSLSL